MTIDRITSRCRPLHGIGLPTRLHIIKAQPGVVGLGNVTRSGGCLAEHKGHVGLTGTEPYLTDGDMTIDQTLFSGFNRKFVVFASLCELPQLHLPFATQISPCL